MNFLKPFVRVVFATVFASSTLSQQVFAHTEGKRSPTRTTQPAALMSAAQAESVYRHLIETHWTPKTGLFRSFPDSSDLKLSQQASTYEQAAMGLLCIRFEDWDRARQLFRFFKSAWFSENTRTDARQGARGLANFYNADFGSEGIEKTIHAGPNAWAGLFAARLANKTHDPEALQWALDVEYWMANILPHANGGVVMGLRDDPQGARWSRIFSTENNLSYYSFLTELLRSTAIPKPVRTAITMERDHVEHWLLNVAYDKTAHRMLRGVNPEGPDRMLALDTYTWLISAIGPEQLAERGIDPERAMRTVEKTFEVTVGQAFGMDPTDQQEADRTFADLKSHPELTNRPPTDHHRVIWYEGMGQTILAWCALADFAERQKKPVVASAYLQKARRLTNAFDQAALAHYPSRSAFPYATPGQFFRYGWGAPKGSDQGPASSLIAGVWRCFAGLGMDPLAGRDVASLQTVRVHTPARYTLAKRATPVLYGTSEDMTSASWNALHDGDWDRAIAQSEATIQEWSKAALYLQRKKMQDVGNLVDYTGDPAERKSIFSYWALNDVAAAYFILGQALDHKRNYAQASQAFRQVVNHYSLAQIWDPKGWFWSPVDAITNDYVMRDQTHYGWVLPHLVAEGSRVGKKSY